jgi:hypothetical protein
MNITVHGTKGGYRILYSTPNSPTTVSDARSAASNESAVGQSAYSIAFAADGCVFTKYVIVRDMIRSKATGNIAFSVHLPNSKKLSGTDIISLLDRLTNTYCNVKKYIVNNNLDNVHEDWSFIETIAKEFSVRDSANYVENIQAGAADAAFVYYSSDVELQKYFDAPCQEEYSRFKQVFFVKSDLRGKPENPLNALRHDANANLTGIIDLENRYYYLNNYNSNRRVFITANGKNCSGEKHNNRIRANWTVEIRFSKDERCYFPIEAKGKLSDAHSEIHKFLEIKGNIINIKYEAFYNPDPKTKSVIIELRDRKGNPVDNAEIQIGDYQSWQKVNGWQYEYTFKGEEIVRDWTVSARKIDSNGKNVFIPERTSGNVILKLIEHKVITLNVTGGYGEPIYNFEVWIKLTGAGGFTKTTARLEFIDEQITGCYNIIIRKDGYEEKRIDNFYPPSMQDKDIKIELRRKLEYYGGNEPAGEQAEKKRSFFSKLLEHPILCASIAIVAIVLGLGIWMLLLRLETDKAKGVSNVDKDKIVDTLNSNQIADSTNAISKPIEKAEEKAETTKTKEKAEEKKAETTKTKEKTEEKKAETPKPQEQSVTSSSAQTSVQTEKITEITNYLQGGDLSEAKLKEYKEDLKNNNDNNIKNIKECIELCLKLWDLDGTMNNSYSWMQDKITQDNKYEILRKSALKKFLDKMNDKKQTQSPRYWEKITGNKTKSKTLKNIEEQK